MKKRILLLLSLIFSLTLAEFAQTKTVTNKDLEKFRQARLEAERDYAENYEKLGFPSPQELKKQIEEDERRLRELSERLRIERLERERAEALADRIDLLEAQNNLLQSQDNRPVVRNNNYYGYTPYFYPSYGFYNYRYRSNRSNYDRRRRYWRYNSIPPIRPPKPIRPPRFLWSSPKFRNKKR